VFESFGAAEAAGDGVAAVAEAENPSRPARRGRQ